MSVWFTETFRGQIFWDWARLKGLSSEEWAACVRKTDVMFTGGKLAATASWPAVDYPSGPAKTLVDDPSAKGKEFRRIFYTSLQGPIPKKAKGRVTLEVLKRAEELSTGLKSVYSIFLSIYEDPAALTAGATHEERAYLETFIQQGFRTQTANMRTTSRVAEAVHKELDQSLVRKAATWDLVARKIRQLITMRHKSDFNRAMFIGDKTAIPDAAIDLELPAGWRVLFDGWVTYLQTPEDPHNLWHALTSADVDRLQQMCISMSMLEMHGATWATTSGNELSEYLVHKRALLRVFIDGIRNSLADDPHKLCQNFRKVFNIYLSMAAGPLSEEGTRVMMDEAKSKGFLKMVSSGRYLKALCAAPFDIAQDIGRIYKLLPAPDYDIGESFVERQKSHLAPNPLEEIDGDNPCDITEFRRYLRKLMMITLAHGNGGKGVGRYRGALKPRWFEAYQRDGSMPEGLAWVDEVDLLGTAPYVQRSDESVVTWKDSACCEEDYDQAVEERSADDVKRNMLLRYLYDPACPDIHRARENLSRSSHVHRVGFKMEAHKPVARIFFIGNLSDRLIQSEMEENVHRVAQHCPGYMIGQGPEFTTKKVMGMVAPDLNLDETAYYLNFDISGWSPNMRADIQKLSHSIWAEVFNEQSFDLAHKINEKSTVVLNKRGYHGTYENPGANFEGYNGKEMTFLHCALMGYSVFRYRRESGHQLTAKLCAYIDDGLATFIDKTANGPNRFLAFCKTMEQTYRSLGYVLELSKCFLSDSFAIFLNEIYLGGRHVTYGLRAIMRVGTTVFEKTDTMCARLNTYFSGTQGALKAGMTGAAGFCIYLWLAGRVLRDYGANRHMDARAAVLYLFTPRALGGAGSPGYTGMTTNLVADGFTEGVGIIRHMVRAYPDYRDKVLSLLRQPVKSRSYGAMVLAPKSVSDYRAPMSESRLSSAVADAIRGRGISYKAKRFLRSVGDLNLDEFGEALLSTSDAIIPSVINDIVAGTPYALLLSLVKKFESARTMTQLVGARRLATIARQNREDAFKSLATFKLR